MDTATVLEIIKMIDAKLLHIARTHTAGNMTDVEFYSSSTALCELSSHLQCYVEQQINAIENSTGE